MFDRILGNLPGTLIFAAIIYWLFSSITGVNDWPEELAVTQMPDCQVFDILYYAEGSSLPANCQKGKWFGIKEVELKSMVGDIVTFDYELLKSVCSYPGLDLLIEAKSFRKIDVEDKETGEAYKLVMCKSVLGPNTERRVEIITPLNNIIMFSDR